MRWRALPVLVALLAVLAVVWSAQVWTMLVVALGGAWLVDWLWARSLARGLSLQRELRYGWAQVGDELEERFTLTARGKLPALWVEIRDHSTLPGYRADLATGVGGESETAWRTREVCARRGVFALGPTEMRSGTPFGLYALEWKYSAQEHLVVMPAVVPLPGVEVAPGGRAREGRRRASTLEPTVSAASAREYAPGDPFRVVHWPLVAHRDALMVRTFESTPAGDWWILLDLDERAQAGEGGDSTIEHAVILAASLIEQGLAEGRAVGLAANARELAWHTPEAGPGQRLKLLRALALVEPAPGTLAELLRRTGAALKGNASAGASVIVVTAAVEGAWIESLLPLKWAGSEPTVLLFDRADYGGEGTGAGARALLGEWDIKHYAVTREWFNRREEDEARQGHWEWRVNATGRAVPQSAPRESAWRTLA